ncbi:fungal-specific transcription factor domain-containing protein [Schizothecium vesticola]|uniref:Fungal-specific transcription factor domain-containing protein n=1 Tax=Schizothecium vesticola TaxID=314040 RepID=A0AA40K962_9PEZI|nr:fungal-specific transcription factor domain-containing protein [Schizothecium vesticola]
MQPSRLGNPAEPPEISAPDQKKRNRIRFSCTHCREKKLKCNRQAPCDQCEKRDIAAGCRIIPYESAIHYEVTPVVVQPAPVPLPLLFPPRPKPHGDSALQARLKHLEHLVHVLRSQQRRTGPDKPPDPDDLPREVVELAEKAGLRPGDQRYLDGANWESIMEEITALTGDLRTHDEPLPSREPEAADHGLDSDASRLQGPILLLGGFPRAPVDDLVALLPARPLVDRMVGKFFEAKQPSWMIFHIPVFMRQYKNFWEGTAHRNPTFVGLIFVMCSHAALYSNMVGEELPGNIGDSLEMFNLFRARAAQCLTLGDYTKPGLYKVQAMYIHYGSEFLRQHEAMLGASTLLCITIRLAMHMGMHRDPRHYPGMTPYEGEMRRRMWSVLVEVDLLISFQFGLPSNIIPGSYDTELPRNLHDEDFDEHSIHLPPSRPETELTVTLLNIVKGRMMDAFGAITTAAGSRKPVGYAEIMRIDKQLEEAHKAIPYVYRFQPFAHSLLDPIDLIAQRNWLELVYQKSRVILHRRYLSLARSNRRYAYSRRACIDAATQILRHQYDLHCEIQTGGRLAKNKWFLNSFIMNDILLADMILCLEFAYLKSKEPTPDTAARGPPQSVSEGVPDVLSKDHVAEILRTSRLIWQATRKESSEADRGFKLLSKMLAMSTGDTARNTPDPQGVGEQYDWMMAPLLPLGVDTGSSLLPAPARVSPLPNSSQRSADNFAPWPPSDLDHTAGQLLSTWAYDIPVPALLDAPPMDGLEVLDPTLGSSWTLFDNQIQNPTNEPYQVPWDAFFQNH